MKKHLYRTIAIYAVLILTAIYIYPTIGWMTLSDTARQERLAKWKQEDSVYREPNFFQDAKQGVERWAQFDRSKVVNLGLDLQGGVHIVLGFELTPELIEQKISESYVQEMVLQRIRRRVNEFEAKDPIIQAMGTNQIQIQLPGEKDVDRVKNLITKTAYLTFNLVAGHDEMTKVLQKVAQDPKFNDRFTPFLLKPNRESATYRVPVANIDQVKDVIKEANESGLLPDGKIFALSQPPNPSEAQEYKLYLMDKNPLTTGDGLKMAMAQPDQENPGNSLILFEFSGEGASRFGDATGANVGKAMGIVVDGVVVSAPVIQSRISHSGQITGSFTQQQAQDLAIALNSGSMPVPIREEYAGVVGASLGSDSIRMGINASIFALLAVTAFMLLYYRFGGLISCVALLLNALIMLAAFAYFGLTLTLPGIAGFVLTLGMAVDANVLIFERIREEVRNGKSLISAIQLGYERAAVTVLDANITTLIAALVLLQFGTGPVQGFGVALAIGILTSIFTALIVTHAIFDWLIDKKRISKLTMMSIIPMDTKIPFLALRNRAFTVAGLLIVVGIAMFFGRGFKNNFGVDFASGTSMVVTVNADGQVTTNDVRSKLADAGFANTIVQEYGEGSDLSKNEFSVRTSTFEDKTSTEANDDISARVKSALAPLAQSDPEKVVLSKVETVGPAIGKQLAKDAFSALFWSMFFMIIYMWFRYNFVFGITGVIALIHDTLIATGFLAIFGGHIDMNVIAAMLTIIGFSINDTIVVYDRIRENMKLYLGRGMSYGEVMDLAINQTLSRTVLTSGLTFLAVLMLFFFGGEVLHDFALYLIIGIIVGTYSSIFVASALAYNWNNYIQARKHRLQAAAGKALTAKTKKADADKAKDKVSV